MVATPHRRAARLQHRPSCARPTARALARHVANDFAHAPTTAQPATRSFQSGSASWAGALEMAQEPAAKAMRSTKSLRLVSVADSYHIRAAEHRLVSRHRCN